MRLVTASVSLLLLSDIEITGNNREKNELTEEAHGIIKTIKQMEASLEDQKPNGTYELEDQKLKVTVPLARCVASLKEKYNTIARLHAERFEQVKSKDDTQQERLKQV